MIEKEKGYCVFTIKKRSSHCEAFGLWSASVEFFFVDSTLYCCEINLKKHLIFGSIDDLLHLQLLFLFL